jgi:hypothetical protein
MLVTSSRFCFDIEHETTDLDRESHPRWTCATPSASRPIPTAAWTLQQLREAIPFDHEYRFIIHDHDAIFSAELDASLTLLGLEVITTPVRSPQANSLCERLIGTLRRECLDWIIPLSEGVLEQSHGIVDGPLQPRQTTFRLGTRHSRSEVGRPPSQTLRIPVLSQKLNPDILMMEPTENRYCCDAAELLRAPKIGHILFQ